MYLSLADFNQVTEIRSAEECFFTDEETAACVDEGDCFPFVKGPFANAVVAHRHGLRVCSHARARDSVIQCVKHGVDVIYHGLYPVRQCHPSHSDCIQHHIQTDLEWICWKRTNISTWWHLRLTGYTPLSMKRGPLATHLKRQKRLVTGRSWRLLSRL